MNNIPSKTILLVEDDAVIALSEKRMLEKYKFSVLVAANGERAVKFCREKDIDLVLMDINLGKGIDGTQAAEQILAESDIPIIFLSSHTERDIVEKTEGITSYGYIVKSSGETVMIASIKMAFRLAEAKKLEKEKEKSLRITLTSIGDAVIATDSNGQITRMNPIAESLTGWDEQEAIGLHLDKVFHIINEDTREIVESPVAKVLEKGEIVGLANHTILVTKKGDELAISDSGAPIKDDNGQITGVVLVFRDQTEERLARRFSDVRLELLEKASHIPLSELLTLALDKVCGLAKSPIGFYHFVEPDQKTLSLQQWSTKTRTDFCHVEGHAVHYDISQAGVWVDCVKERKPIIHNDYESLSHKKGLPEGHAPVIRELVVPVMRNDKVVAILGVGNKLSDYTQKDVDIVSYLADVTWEIVGDKRAEEALEKSEQMLNDVLDTIPVKVFWKDLDCNYLGSNTLFASEKGFKSSKQLIGKSDYDLKTPQADEYRKDDMEVMEKDLPKMKFIEQHTTSTGDTLWLNTSKIPLRYSDGTVYGVLGICEDITEVKKREERLTESERKYRTLLETSPDPIALLDFNGQLLFGNNKFAEIHGLESPHDWIGKSSLDLVAPDYREKGIETIKEVIEQGFVENAEIKFLRMDGSTVDVEINGALLKDNHGEPKEILMIARDLTERKKYHDALDQNREQLSIALASSRTGIWDWHVVTNKVFFDENYFRISGYEPNEFPHTFEEWEKRVHPDDISDAKLKIDECLNLKTDSYKAEFRFKKKNGEWMWIYAAGTVVEFSSNGKPVRFTGIHTDIQERKLAQLAVLREKIRVENIISGTNAGTWDWDLENDETEINDRWAEIVGYTKDELTPVSTQRQRELVHPEDISYVRTAIERHFARETEYYNAICRLRHKKGHWVWVNVRGKVVEWSSDGKPMRMSGTHVDISDSKQYLDMIESSEQRFRDLFENIPAACFTFDEMGTIHDWNRECEKTYGWKSFEAIGKTMFQLFVQEKNREITIKNIKKIFKGEKVENIEFEDVRADGKKCYVLSSEYPLKDNFDNVVLGVCAEIDITERKFAENKIKQLLSDKEVLLKEVHHRIKNNMHTISSLLQLHAKSIDNSDAIVALEDAINRVNSMRVLYEKLMMTDEYRETSIKNYTENLISEVRNFFKGKGNIKFNVSVDDFNLDSKRLFPIGIIINELVTNIVKHAFSGEKEGEVSIELKKEGEIVRLQIKDNGKGLPKDFELEEANSFGLLLVKMLAQQLDATFAIVSQEIGTESILEFEL